MTKTVLITGCSSGFGAAGVRAFSAKGWNVVATARKLDDMAPLADVPNLLAAVLDVQDPASIDAAVKAGIGRFGRIDALVNNAGFGLFGIFEGTTRDKIQQQFDVNVFGVMDVTRALLPHFRENRSGAIVNVSSGAGAFTLPMISLYCASKFALEGFSEALSYELADLGIQVKIVEPGGVTSTKFGERSGAEVAGVAAPEDYAPFQAKAGEIFDKMRASRAAATSEEVAEIIVVAAEDRSDRIRWVATDDIKPLVAARRETSEDEYRSFMLRYLGLRKG